MTFTDTAAIWVKDYSRLHSLVRRVSGEKVLQEALNEGRGVLLALPHLGAWELMGLYCGHKYQMTALYRQPRLPGLDEWLRRSRERTGAVLLPADQIGVRGVLTALKAGKMACILPDQEPKRGEGIFSPFFGRSALTMVLYSRLLQKTGAKAILGFVERDEELGGFHIHFQELSAGVYSQDLEAGVASLNLAIEESVRSNPAQYQWGYRRFNLHPDGGRSKLYRHC